MSEAQTIYLRPHTAVPFTHHLMHEIEVPAIDRDTIAAVTAEAPIEATSITSTGREFLPNPFVTLTLKDGHRLSISQVEASLAIQGGGRFLVACPNPLYDQPITRETFEQLEREREEEEAREAAEWYDD